jgi:hypothetical protein
MSSNSEVLQELSDAQKAAGKAAEAPVAEKKTAASNKAPVGENKPAEK